MAVTRRGFVRRTGAAVVGGIVSAVSNDRTSADATTCKADCRNGKSFENWAKTIKFEPERYCRPTCEEQVIEIVKEALHNKTHVRTVAAGHSFSQLVVTPDTLVSLKELEQVQTPPGANPYRVTVPAGMSLENVIETLKKKKLAFKNLGSITRQSIAGAISTGTHGSGLTLGSLSTQVVGVRLIDGEGKVRTYTDASGGDHLAAARISLGALGILTEVTLECIDFHKLELNAYLCSLDDVLNDLDNLAKDNLRVLFWWLLPPKPFDRLRHKVIVITKNPLGYAGGAPKGARDVGDPHRFAERVHAMNPCAETFLPLLAEVLTTMKPGPGCHRFLSLVEDYDKVLTLPMPEPPAPQLYHRECEYAIPADPGTPGKEAVAALRAFQRRMDECDLTLLMPVEVRFVAKDDVLLSPAYARDVCYIGASALTCEGLFHEDNAAEVFTRFEPIMRRHGGKPHWGKLFSLTRSDVERLYPVTYQRFRKVRDYLDPKSVFVNSMLEELFL